jgi:hypothetical protein
MAVAASAREVPIEIIKQRRAWKDVGDCVERGEYSDGVVAASLSTLVAANAKGNFLKAHGVIICSMTTAALAFLITTFNAALKAKGFALAGRELETAIARYRFDEELPEKYLGHAEARGIEILNQFDSKKSGS